MGEVVGIKAKKVEAKGNIIVSYGYDQKSNPYGYVGISDQYFVGRKQIIRSIQTYTQVDMKHVIVLYGLGGMGKSEIAKKWSEQYSVLYNFILRLLATDENTLRDSFRSLAQSLGLHIGSEGISPEDIAKVYKILGKHRARGVLIFDDVKAVATETGQEWKTYRPPKELAERICIIVTSRVGGNMWKQLCEPESITFISVQGLSEAESYECFLKYLQLNGGVEESVKLKITPLLKRHHGYPLSLSFLGRSIAAHMEEGTPRSDAPNYMECVLRDLQVMLTDDTLETLSIETLYSDSFKIIYNDTLDAIRFLNQGNDAIQYLQLLACLQLDSVPVGLLRAIYKKEYNFSPRPEHNAVERFKWSSLDRDLRVGLSALEKYCLATTETITLTSSVREYHVDKIRLENVVHSFINFHRQSNPASREESVEKLIEASGFFERNQPCREFLPHISFLLENLVAAETNNKTARCAAILYWKLLQEYVIWNPPQPDFQYCLDLLNKVILLGQHLLAEDQILVQLADFTAKCLAQSQEQNDRYDFRRKIQMLTIHQLSHRWIPTCCLNLLTIAVP